MRKEGELGVFGQLCFIKHEHVLIYFALTWLMYVDGKYHLDLLLFSLNLLNPCLLATLQAF